MTTVSLSKPIMAHGDELSELTLRPPITKDIIQLGLPTLIIPSDDGESTGIEIRQPVIARYIMRLAAIPMSSVIDLDISDFSLCTAAVMSFFGAGDGGTPKS